MKKLFTLILILIILPVTLCLTGCKKEEKRKTIEFYNTYLNIIDEYSVLVKQSIPDRFNASETIYKVGFTYSIALQTKIATVNAYSYLEDMYNILLDDALGPMYMFGDKVQQVDLSKKQNASLYKKLDALLEDYAKISSRLIILESTLSDSSAPQNLEKLYNTYENAILHATILSAEVASIYYSEVLLDPNPNYSAMTDATINLNSLATRAYDRLVYYKSIYVNAFMNTCFVGRDVPLTITQGTFNSTYEPYSVLSATTYETSANNSTILNANRSALAELGRTLYYIQQSFETEYSHYLEANSNIIYVRVNDESSLTDKAYKSEIDKFVGENGISYASYKTIKAILDICYKI